MAVSASRKARIELTASAAGMDPGLRAARRKMRTFERDQARAAKEQERAQQRAMRGAFGLGRSVMHGLAAAAGFDLAGGIGGLASDVIATEKELTRFQIDAQLSTAQVSKFRDELMRTSQQTGVSRNALVRGAHAYQILTGDAAGAVQQARLFADVANASGASMEDIAATAAAMRQNLGLDPSQFRRGFDMLLSLGHKGSIEIRDLAAEMSGLAPQFKDFGGKSPLEKTLELGSAMQIVRKNFKDAEEAATGMRSLMAAFAKKSDKLAAFGVQTFTIDPTSKRHVARDFLDIVHDIIKNPALDDKVLPTLLGRQEAVRTLDAMRDHWDEIGQLMHEAANSNQVAKDSQTYMNSTAGKLARAWEHIKNAVAGALTPERIDAFANAALKASDAFTSIVEAAEKVLRVWKKIYGPTVEEDAADIVKHSIARDEKQGIGPLFHADPGSKYAIAGYNDLAHREERMAAELERQQEDGGLDRGGRLNLLVAEQMAEFYEGRAAAAANAADPWGTVIGQKGSFAPASNFSAASFASALERAFRRATSDLKITVNIDGNAVVKAYGGATSQRTRPGGR